MELQKGIDCRLLSAPKNKLSDGGRPVLFTDTMERTELLVERKLMRTL